MKVPPPPPQKMQYDSNSNGNDVTTSKTNRNVHYDQWLLLELSSGKC